MVDKLLNLQKFAIRVLNHSCALDGEHNWSVF